MHTIRDLEERLACTTTAAARLATLNDLAFRLNSAGEPGRALPLAREAQELAAGCTDDRALSQALCNVGTSHFLHARYAAALEECLRALALAERAADNRSMASALVSAAGCQYQMGAREESLQTLYRALELIDATPCNTLNMRAHNGLGVLLCDKRRFAESEIHYRHAIQLAAAHGDAFYVARIKMNYAGLYLDRGALLAREGKRERADADLRAGLALCEEVLAAPVSGASFVSTQCLGISAELHRELGDEARASELFAQTDAQAAELGNPHLRAETLANLGKLRLRTGKAVEARAFLEEALAFAIEANVRPLIADVFLSLANVYETIGDFERALEYHKRFHALKEDLLQAEAHAAGVAHEIWHEFRELSKRVDGLMRAAHEDSLTGLSNRRCLDARLAELVASARDGALKMCVGIIDIDHFKAINDRFSHTIGDAVLRHVADTIRAHCREGDVSARYGGDEFVICLLDNDLDTGIAVLNRLRNVVSQHAWSALHAELGVTLSIGVAEVVPGDSVASLFSRVDAALYRAKAAGRDRVSGS